MSRKGSGPRFCVECGTPLPEGAKFCPECGTAVAAPAKPAPAAEDAAPAAAKPEPAEAPAAPVVPPELRARYEEAQKELRGDRREVVVLFADLQGFTALSERMDPEEVSLLVQRLLGELAEAVHRYEGYVDKYIGDAIMALFGAPIAHENDAERAVLAALDMLRALERRNEGADHKLSLRVGLNLGEVVAAHVGSGSRLQYTVMGDAVNVASRLEGAAEPDTILVSRSVHERVASRFDTEEMPPVTLKGKSEPLPVHRVVGLRPFPRTAPAPRTPFVGREEELKKVGAFLDTVPTGTARPLVLVAEAGAGKSRLVLEAVQRSDVDFARADVALTPLEIPGRLAPVAELFRQVVAPDAGDDGEAALERALALLDDDAVEEHRSGVVGLVREACPGAPLESATEETDDPRAARQNRWLALAALLGAVGRERPVLVVVEDLQWADEQERELLAFLVPALARKPVGLLMTSRARVYTEWLGDAADELELEPLGADAARSILGGLMDTLRPRVRREILRRSQGNPLYLEELALSLEGAEDVLAVPGTVQGLLQARIDRLDPPVRLVLQMAAVLGPRFSVELLRRMYGLDPRSLPFEAALGGLEEHAFVESTGEEDERRFRHALMQEVAYGGILHRLRKVLHESAARLGEELYADRIEAEAPFFADHYWRAELREAAAPHLLRAAMTAAGQYDLHAAERWFGRLSDILTEFPGVIPQDSDRAGMMLRHGAVLLDRGRYDAADELFRELEAFGSEAGRDDWVARALRYRGQIAALRGRLDDARELFERGLARVPPGETKTRADLETGLGLVLYYEADGDAALARLEAALALYEQIDDDLGRAKCYINIGNVLDDLKHDRDAAQPSYERALELTDQAGDRRLKTGVLLNLGALAMARGDWDDALRRFHDVEAFAEEAGWSFMRFLSLQNRAACELWRGRVALALGHLATCLREGEAMMKARDRVRVREFQFEARITGLDPGGAAAKLDEARRVAEEVGTNELEDSLLVCEGRLRAAEGEWEAARRAFAEALEAAARLGHPDVETLARAHLHRAATRTGGEAVDPPSPDAIRHAPTRAVVEYLTADAMAEREPGEEAARALEAAGETAAGLECRAIERAAFERAASLWEAMGDGKARERALERAARAMAALEAFLPADLREPFAAHSRNAALRERIPG